jgi:undecaprenyl diphosphate synthase
MRQLNTPKHIAFIVDGNRRWARQKGLPQQAGHVYVVEKVLDALIDYADKKGIKYLTFWTFSTENWKRGSLFVHALFRLLEKSIETKASGYHKKGYRFNMIGDMEKLPQNLVKMLKFWQEKTKNNSRITVTIAINYGGRDEIIRAIKTVSNNQFPISNLTKDNFQQFLDTKNIPDPGLIIRTGGEKRLSGFLLWQSEYSELYFTDTLMPDFGTKEFSKALVWFSQRQRRFGK